MPIRLRAATCSRLIRAGRTAWTSPMAGPYRCATVPPARPRKISAIAARWPSAAEWSTYSTTSHGVLGCTWSK